MLVSVTCKTDRFNLSVVGDEFINDCCFGEDFSKWLVSALCETDVDAGVICMEDFGWANAANFEGASYFLAVGGHSYEDASRPNYGEWRVVLQRHRTLMQKILGKNKMVGTDPMIGKVEQVMKSAGFADVATEF